ncbi:hypothetical protein CYMTET_47957 [Cymbomonas tetramitiformis]|uniref:Uncharacterized protein n=1 Tax=Cymbomonas tetramitiformis TaxID=36881 RepID=A0AAE0BT58_9CHLO|nr:hypothetical protein CYMTET_47957 [Cymbomonas tetramitiformis]
MTSPHGQLPTPFSENAPLGELAGAASAGQHLPAGLLSSDPVAVREMSEVQLPSKQDLQNAEQLQRQGLRHFPSRSDMADWRTRQQQGATLAWTPRPNQGGVGAAVRSDVMNHSNAGEPTAHSMHPTPSSASNGEVGAAGRTGGSGLTGGPRHISIAHSGQPLTSPITDIATENKVTGDSLTSPLTEKVIGDSLTSTLTQKVTGDSLTSPITDIATEHKVIGDALARLSVTFESEMDSEATSLTPSLTQATTEAATEAATDTAMLESLLNRESRPLTSSLTSPTTEQPVSTVSSVSYADLACRRAIGLAAYQPPPLPVVEPPSQADVLSRIPVRNLSLSQDSVNQLSRRERRHQRWEQHQQRLAEQRRVLLSDPASVRTPAVASIPVTNHQHQALVQNQMMLEVSEYMQNLHQQVLQRYPHLLPGLPAVGAPPLTPYQHTLGWAGGLPGAPAPAAGSGPMPAPASGLAPVPDQPAPAPVRPAPASFQPDPPAPADPPATGSSPYDSADPDHPSPADSPPPSDNACSRQGSATHPECGHTSADSDVMEILLALRKEVRVLSDKVNGKGFTPRAEKPQHQRPGMKHRLAASPLLEGGNWSQRDSKFVAFHRGT